MIPAGFRSCLSPAHLRDHPVLMAAGVCFYDFYKQIAVELMPIV